MVGSGSTASLVWVFIEWKKFGKPSLVGIATGTIAGLATITPASGFVGPIGGILGTLMVAVFAAERLAGAGAGAGFGEGGTMGGKFVTQVIGVVVTIVWSGLATLVICKVAGAFGGSLRANDDEIIEGLDLSYHGERDYNF